jgi:hypothetical protein
VNGCTNSVTCTEAEHQENRRTEFKILNSDDEAKILKKKKK